MLNITENKLKIFAEKIFNKIDSLFLKKADYFQPYGKQFNLAIPNDIESEKYEEVIIPIDALPTGGHGRIITRCWVASNNIYVPNAYIGSDGNVYASVYNKRSTTLPSATKVYVGIIYY